MVYSKFISPNLISLFTRRIRNAMNVIRDANGGPVRHELRGCEENLNEFIGLFAIEIL